ncbi:MAG: hypothetical protein HKN46_05570 [Acidimicrobiia bacterium]|nr:hypothetical protein [Acidimicrobiia bacterium]
MYDQGPKRLRINDTLLEAKCPASRLPGRTNGPRSSLDRWKAVLDCITQWHIDGAPADVSRIEQDLLGAFDPVQRDLCARAFRAWREHIGSDGTATFEPLWPSVTSDDGTHYLSAPMQVELTHEDGSVEHIKVKASSPTSDEERAVVTLAAEEGVDYLEILLEPGQVDALPIDPARAEAIIEELFALAEVERERTAEYRPGFHCWRCRRVSVCARYPSLAGDPPPSGTPSVTLSKSTLAHLDQCPRRVAWKSLIHVPVPGDDDFGGPARAMGIGFHAAIAAALGDDDPAGVMEAHAQGLPASERADFLGLWDTHQALGANEAAPVEVSATELSIGCTAPAPTSRGTHAVTFLGIADAAGREADGTPAVIEHRTTAARELPYLEQELYAVAGARAVGAERIAVHHHWLRAPLDEACTRRVFEPEDLTQAAEALLGAATQIASWSREDATSAAHRVGPWCEWCPYQALCIRHRG